VVISVVGILAAITVPRFVARDGFASRGFFDEATEAVRYAQKIAVAWRRDVYVCVTASPARVRVSLVSDCSTPLTHPATGNALVAQAPSGIGLPTQTFRFTAPSGTQAGGQPFTFTPGPVAAAEITINISGLPGDPARRIVVERETGYVHN